MSEAIAIRDAEPADLEAIVAIYNETIEGRMATADLAPVTLAEREAWFAAHGPQRRPLWVAERDGAVAAWLSFSDFHERAAYAITAEVSVYVASAHRGAGVATTLLARAVEHAPALGLRRLVGLIFAHNEPSLALFAKHGFERWGLLPEVCELDGRPASVVIVGRSV